MRFAFILASCLPFSAFAEDETPTLSDVQFKGRTSPAVKAKLLKINDGSTETEERVARGLAWLSRQQQTDGYWEADGTAKADRTSMTALALLAYLGAGIHEQDKRYSQIVLSAIHYLMDQQKADGSFQGVSQIDGHAWATQALVEASVLTKIAGTDKSASKALTWLVKQQQVDGSWGSTKGKFGRAIYLAWPYEVITVASRAGYQLNRREIDAKINLFLKDHTWNEGTTYGFSKEKPCPDLSASLPWVRYLNMGPHHDAEHQRSTKSLFEQLPSDKNPILLQRIYFAHQFMKNMDEETWKTWNLAVKATLLKTQKTDSEDPNRGYWSADAGDLCEQYGTMGCTAMAILSLEVYYRYLPLYKRELGGLKELER